MEAAQIVNRSMDKQNVIHAYSRILFCLEKENHSDTHYNMDEAQGHYTM